MAALHKIVVLNQVLVDDEREFACRDDGLPGHWDMIRSAAGRDERHGLCLWLGFKGWMDLPELGCCTSLHEARWDFVLPGSRKQV